VPGSAKASDEAVGIIKAGRLTISAAWTRATPAGSKVAGGFVTITNTGKTADVLIGGSFAHAARVEIYQMSVVDDVMRMRELPNGLEIKPGATIVLKPGSYHLMFMGLKQQIKAGEVIRGTLVFKSGGEVPVSFTTAAMGSKSMVGRSHGGHEGHTMGGPSVHGGGQQR